MADIGGNITGVIQVKSAAKNAIGESVKDWTTTFEHTGWLDLLSGDSEYTSYLAKVKESTHIFLCDYHAGIYALSENDTRMIINGFVYDVTYIDNPQERNEHLEIFLRKVGAWNG